MQPRIGWTLLSRDALKRAEAQLSEEVQGVRDEIGFLALHQAYADRFFPGTSVLHTRLRYALFVPWIYESIKHRAEHIRIDTALQREEVRLAGRLKKSGEKGVIGGRIYPKPTSQPPSMIYWTALGSWGLLRRRLDGSLPSRANVHSALRALRASRTLHDDDHELLEEGQSFFASVPPPPQDWEDPDAPLSFNLTKREAAFLRRHLASVPLSLDDSRLSLFSELVERNVHVKRLSDPWVPSVLKAASQDDRHALIRAQQAAALAAIGRGIYAALVEYMCEQADKRLVGNLHRDALKVIIKEHQQDALACDITEVCLDAGQLPSLFIEVLETTQQWLTGIHDSRELLELYGHAEVMRKGLRARLSDTRAGRKRRQDWNPEEHPEAEPLHYRWQNVKRLITDLVEYGT